MLFKAKTNRLKTGKLGEDLVALYLADKGYQVLERNYRQRFGEVDIIAEKDGILIFVEVKTRSSTAYGTAFEAVDQRKQHQLSKIASHYLLTRKLTDSPARFDVASVSVEKHGAPVIDIIENAFEFIG